MSPRIGDGHDYDAPPQRRTSVHSEVASLGLRATPSETGVRGMPVTPSEASIRQHIYTRAGRIRSRSYILHPPRVISR